MRKLLLNKLEAGSVEKYTLIQSGILTFTSCNGILGSDKEDVLDQIGILTFTKLMVS